MDKKFIAIIIVLTIGIIGMAIFISGSSPSAIKATISKTEGAKIYVDHSYRKVGDIGYSNGILYHRFPVKNEGNKDLEIANMTTSCMCTEVFLKKDGQEGPKFGMKGMTAPSAWKGVLKPGQSAEIIAAFDPAYHGPQGIGEVSRIRSLETNDPDLPYIELSFEGTVLK